jgi:hypothetical protein
MCHHSIGINKPTQRTIYCDRCRCLRPCSDYKYEAEVQYDARISDHISTQTLNLCDNCFDKFLNFIWGTY